MKKFVLPLSAVTLSLSTLPAIADEFTPVASVKRATWQQYQNEYQKSTLCNNEEIALWNCKIKTRSYSLCSSKIVTRTLGYMQYRASNRGKVEFTYPPMKVPPKGYFLYNSSANGDASIEFTSKGYSYTLFDPLRGASSLVIEPPAALTKIVEIKCPPNQTLQVNYTMRLMLDSGIWISNEK
jgi:hypothetical protein